MSGALPTPAEVEGMQERHVPTDLGRVEVCCQGCEDTSGGCVPWPCDAARLLALVDSAGRPGRVEWLHGDRAAAERDEARDRLDAVLAALPNHDTILAAQASWGGYARDFVRLTARIRRAATGEAS